MRRSIRTLFVCMLVALMVYQPALACRSCGGCGGGHHATSYYSHGPVVYSGGCCGGGYSYGTVVYDSGCGSCGSCDGQDAAMGERAPNVPSDSMEAPEKAQAETTTAAPPSELPMATPAEVTPQPQLPATPPAALTPPTTTEPATPPAEKAAEPLFGNEPAATPPAATPPAATPPAATPPLTPPPASPPAATPPAAEKAADDLFGGAPENASAPATPPAATPPAATPPAATPPAATPPAASPGDDLFGTSTKEEPKSGGATTTTQKPAETPPAAEPKPAEIPAAAPAGENKSKPADAEKKEEKPKAEEKDPLFGSAPSVLHEAGGLASSEMRLWTDNSGNFTCRGRLVRFYEGQVRLLKENGRTATVPLARLSTGDLEFVNRQASAQQTEIGKTAQSPPMLPTFAN